MSRHANWCEVNQGGGYCDCGAEQSRNQETRTETNRRLSKKHANWCELNQGGIYCDCGIEDK